MKHTNPSLVSGCVEAVLPASASDAMFQMIENKETSRDSDTTRFPVLEYCSGDTTGLNEKCRH